jgi:hypothetical protein
VPALEIPARGWQGIDARLLQQPFITQYGRWIWAIYQWMVYRGPITSIGVALAIIAVWHQVRLGRARHNCISIASASCGATVPAADAAQAGETPAPQPSRDCWARRFACLGRSMLTVAALWMLPYLWLMPTVVQFGEEDYQIKIAYIENPDEYRNALAKIMVEVRADQSWRKDAHSSKETP